MKIGLVSDSHGNLRELKRAVTQMGDVDLIFHMGDYADDAQEIKKWKSIPVFSVKGNMDTFSPYGETEILTEAGGKTILACHGHLYHVKTDYSTLRYRALEAGADMVFFGHTHLPFVDQSDDLLMINPGSCTLPHGSSRKSYGIVTIEETGCIHAELRTVLSE